jgi:hypothetical protein
VISAPLTALAAPLQRLERIISLPTRVPPAYPRPGIGTSKTMAGSSATSAPAIAVYAQVSADSALSGKT